MINKLKYIKLFEAFKSNLLSKAKNLQRYDNFLNDLKTVLEKYNFPESEISDDYFDYVGKYELESVELSEEEMDFVFLFTDRKYVRSVRLDKKRIQKELGTNGLKDIINSYTFTFALVLKGDKLRSLGTNKLKIQNQRKESKPEFFGSSLEAINNKIKEQNLLRYIDQIIARNSNNCDAVVSLFKGASKSNALFMLSSSYSLLENIFDSDLDGNEYSEIRDELRDLYKSRGMSFKDVMDCINSNDESDFDESDFENKLDDFTELNSLVKEVNLKIYDYLSKLDYSNKRILYDIYTKQLLLFKLTEMPWRLNSYYEEPSISNAYEMKWDLTSMITSLKRYKNVCDNFL